MLTDDEKNMLQALKDLWCAGPGKGGLYRHLTVEEYSDRSSLAYGALYSFRRGMTDRVLSAFHVAETLALRRPMD